MKTLTLWQPHASLVANGTKTIETRSWSTSYRGPLAIHAAKAERPEEAPIVALPAFHDALWAGLGFTYRPMPGQVRGRLPRGAIVATCTLVDVVPMVDGPGTFMHPYLHVGDALLVDHARDGRDITDQLPYGNFQPGRFAWLLDDIKPTTQRCPACWDSAPRAAFGHCVDIDGGWWHTPGSCSCGCCDPTCSTCDGRGRCEPVPAKGRQQLWNWSPNETRT